MEPGGESGPPPGFLEGRKWKRHGLSKRRRANFNDELPGGGGVEGHAERDFGGQHKRVAAHREPEGLTEPVLKPGPPPGFLDGTMLPVGRYKTAAGSIVTISGKHGGVVEVDFNWLEENNACIECFPDTSVQDDRLTWYCDECDGGSAELFPVE